jgi:trimeric autotransporter adhesin
MKKTTIFLLLFFATIIVQAQVGINTTIPNAQLDIRSSNQATPTNTDGILIPKVDVFPATNPTAAQQGMLVYLTTTSGTDLPGFYYWNNTTVDWIPIGNNNTNSWTISGNTGTNPTTNFIGTADNVDLVFRRANVLSGRIGTSNTFFGRLSGSVSTANNNTYIGTEAGRDNVTGQQNVFIGRRAGTFGTIGSDNILIGNGAGIFNEANQNCFIGSFSGNGTTTGANNSFYGDASGLANGTGSQNAFFGASSGTTNTIGIGNTLLGTSSNVSANNLNNASAIGFRSFVGANNSMVLGSVNGINGATSSVNVGIGTTTPLDRLHVVGNIRMVDGNQAAGRVLTSNANGTASWTNPIGTTNGTLDQAYDFGGAGNGKTITADAGAVTIDGTDGLVSTGQLFSGVVAPAGAGTRMVWNPRKGAFRAGNVFGIEWDDANMGSFSTAFGENTRASGPYSFSIGYANIASGQSSAAFGQSTTASGAYSAAFGSQTIADGTNSAAFGRQSSASGLVSFSFGQNTGANGSYSAAFGYWSGTAGESSFVAGRSSGAVGDVSSCFGESNTAFGNNSFATGRFNTASGANSTIFGYNSNAFSFGETVMGIGATTYTPSTNGATQFRAANTTDRLFVIGNAIDTNNNDLVDAAERSDALIVLKNGLTRLPSTTNAMITSADGKAVVTKEYLQSNNWSLTGNTGTNAATNFIGTTDNIDLVFRRGNIISGRLGDSNTFFGRNSGVVNTGTSNTFIGERAGIANVSGSANTFLGRLAGANGASGNDNIYLGYAAGLNNTGNGNLMLGAFSSQNTTGSFNVFLGYSAGSNNTTGARNTTIGNQSDLGAANLTNATAIGNLAQVDTSNSLVLGSINGVNGSLVSTNVGIGTTSPLTRLDIVDENTTTSNLVYGNLHVRSNNAQNIDIGGAITLGGYNDDTMVQPRVFGSVEGRKSNATTNSSSGYLSFKTNNAGTLAERMRITNAGSVGIGTTTPGGLFELSLDQGRKPGTNTWTVVSDQRLKTINGNYTKGLNEILQLNPIRFNYKNNGERTFEKEVLDTEFPGFIAQEVQPLFPDAVGTDADGFLNFNIHPILIASVNAIKELNAKNTSLQAENEALKTELNEQKAVLESVLQRLSALEKE